MTTAAKRAELTDRLRQRLVASATAVTLTLPRGGGDVSGARLVLRQRDVPDWGGVLGEYRVSFRAAYDDLPELRAGDIIEADGEVYRVLGVETDAARVGSRLDCGERYANG